MRFWIATTFLIALTYNLFSDAKSPKARDKAIRNNLHVDPVELGVVNHQSPDQGHGQGHGRGHDAKHLNSGGHHGQSEGSHGHSGGHGRHSDSKHLNSGGHHGQSEGNHGQSGEHGRQQGGKLNNGGRHQESGNNGQSGGHGHGSHTGGDGGRHKRETEEEMAAGHIGNLPDDWSMSRYTDSTDCPSQYREQIDQIKQSAALRNAYDISGGAGEDNDHLWHSRCLLPSPHLQQLVIPDHSERKIILDVHNNERAQTPAEFEFTLTWDSELAKTAAGWVSQCKWGHDLNANRDSPGRYDVGQNLAWYETAPANGWKTVVDFWIEEKKDFTIGVGSRNGNMVGHYTQVVEANTYKIGCAFADCGGNADPDGSYMLLYGCDYGPAGNRGSFAHPYVPANSADAKKDKCPIALDDSGLCNCDNFDGNKDCTLTQKKTADCKCVDDSISAAEHSSEHANAMDCPDLGDCSLDYADAIDCPSGGNGCCCTDNGKVVQATEGKGCKWQVNNIDFPDYGMLGCTVKGVCTLEGGTTSVTSDIEDCQEGKRKRRSIFGV